MTRIAIILLIPMLLAGCDEGRLLEGVAQTVTNGYCARIDLQVYNSQTWPEDYTLAVAAFEPGNEFASISKNIEITEDGQCIVTLSGIPDNATTVELCALDRLRRRVASFSALNVEDKTDTLRFPSEPIDLSMYQSIQKEIFNTTCTQCHGGSGYAAANLNLTSGKSHASLVGIVATKEPSLMRVRAGEPDESVLYRILSSNESSDWRYDHSVELPSVTRIHLIANWIKFGAKEK